MSRHRIHFDSRLVTIHGNRREIGVFWGESNSRHGKAYEVYIMPRGEKFYFVNSESVLGLPKTPITRELLAVVDKYWRQARDFVDMPPGGDKYRACVAVKTAVRADEFINIIPA